MTDRYESAADIAIRQAQERGDFDNLPGAGKPLPGAGQHLHEDWWVRDWVAREGISGVLPPGLALKREVQDLDGRLDKEAGTEAEARELVEELNARILKALRGPVEGPPVTVMPVKVDVVLERWRGRKGA
ncbi:DnaJ family domain-containing protein [Phytomonospora endophytica]|uniref:DnaJ homologue subfamily C member 28 conserved domain-containing protein n=1 Tax=Phytomonospora endophytica TaxID=714109 RepID=A0A841FS22_9ACTN|nr:DUF1992 domain-containing protein [Phytomonospora endophytica]MBB6036107.1 hypothetical protein [Phytomonospora endophytica]GIG67010.1 DUF1992 domain-containing protein [Phytomonospora endophytica]